LSQPQSGNILHCPLAHFYSAVDRWIEHTEGSVQLTVRYGSKPLELAKGKTAIMLETKEDIEPTLRSLKLAVLSGEFDELLLSQVGFKLKIGTGKKPI
ncbi:MAG: hypothetical protein O2994_07885, partial [Proteobacteria bacterium]|nr:hypothetical protein [Pseudomonadota bacterium]